MPNTAASPTRKSRLCRDIKALEPSFDAVQAYHMSMWRTIDLCLKNYLRDVTEQQSVVPKKLKAFNDSTRSHSHTLKMSAASAPRGDQDGGERLAKRLKDVAHVRDLKSQNYNVDFIHAVYTNPNELERTGLCARNRLNGALRDHSNAVAIVCKASPTKASNLQISRISIGSVATAELSYQMTTTIVMGLAHSVASVDLGDHIRDPFAGGSVCGSKLRGLAHGDDVFVMAHSACEFLEDCPRFLTPQSFLEKARLLARAEIDASEISRIVNQTTDHLRFTCFRIVPEDAASDGSRVWFAFSLVAYLAVDPRLHTVLEKWNFTEHDLAVSHSMLNYAKRLVGNRSRDTLSKMEVSACDVAKRTLESATGGGAVQMWKSSSARFVDEADSGIESSDDDMDSESVVSASTASVSSNVRIVKLSEIASATRIACTHELARKSRRIDTEPTTVTSVSVMASKPQKPSPKSRSVVSSGMIGAPRVKATLEFLHLHFSQNDGLLLHLYADTVESSINAAKCVLKAQLESKDINKELHNGLTENLTNASSASAIQTRENIDRVCNQAASRSPALSSWVESTEGGPVVYTGLIRRPQMDEQGNASSTRLLVCHKPSHAQPYEACKSSVAWCVASSTTKCFEETSKGVGCAMEAYRALGRTPTDGGPSNKRLLSQRGQGVRRACTKTLGLGESGIARSVLVFDAIVPVSSEVLRAAYAVATQIVEKHTEASRQWADVVTGSRRPEADTLWNTVLRSTGPTQLDSATQTPGVTPSNMFTVGMYLLECSRTALNQIAPKQSLLAVPIAPDSVPSSLESKETKRVNPLCRPWCFLSVNDIKFEAQQPERLHNRLTQDANDEDEGNAPPIHCRQIALNATFTVTGDSAINVPTALNCISKLLLDRGRDTPSRLSLLRQWRSICYVSGIQCSTFNQFSNSVSAREMNTKIEGTSKVDAPDNNYLAFPTIAQCYVVGHTNLPTMFEGTPWQDTYGAGYECGAIASTGINGRMVVSDQRNAAFALMDQEQVDRLCKKLSDRSVVVSHSGDTFLRVPTNELGGLPRQMIPGVHLALAGLEAAFKNLPRGCATEDVRTSIQVLPFSPFSQAVPPVVVSEPSGMEFRDRARVESGRGAADPPTTTEHARPLRTLKRCSILGSEFMQSACVKMICSTSDNFFETIEPAIAPILVFASQIASIAKLITELYELPSIGVPGEAELNILRSASISFFENGTTADVCVPCLLIDAMVLFNAMFPMEFEVGKPCILKALAVAPGSFFASPKHSFAEMQLDDVTEEDRAALLRFQRRLFDSSERGPWTLISNFVSMVAMHGGKFDNSEKELQTCSQITAKLGEIVWLLHSDDGVAPPGKWSPLHCRATPTDVIASDLVCVWVDRPQNSVVNRRIQRGALFGLPNSGPQQLLMLLTGSFLREVEVQYFRNEGNMCLRMSACALKDSEGAKLTAKSTSPIYFDNDAETFGTLEAKEAQAHRQVAAWKKNNDLIFDVSTRFDVPRSDTDKFNGADFHLQHVRDVFARWDATGRVSTEEMQGVELMKRACAT